MNYFLKNILVNELSDHEVEEGVKDIFKVVLLFLKPLILFTLKMSGINNPSDLDNNDEFKEELIKFVPPFF